ncbi:MULTISPECIES: quinolinate synthase NadA [Petrimonas]|jgi:quinolinate synthase|uniref:Quinolinate synthase n=1 Tax=Petrimonas mucosa TaxID=1642646 RepID=A0A1G4G3L9_9BACT|nr:MULTISPECIES: quinolinate synthase NadA [Petrimonas]MDD3560595.1 quinolinate synthase NadA [Petrimonas mucosa]SCM55345.1 Quinolinate synthase A {ECO:0000255/HAMAP-Rule:MF_00568} [Petrimonas mucosa]SFU46065.1 quinolinate synthetase [Porphyromonadaceae bacterium KHP3R9]HHT30649.1 quinolinate synthase NadA [Petrimonas mucosa]
MKKEELIDKIDSLRKEKNAIILAHYYQDADIQDIADFVGDSLALAQWAAKTTADIIVLCGVHFMGETAKILSPDKRVFIPDIMASCSLAESCPADEFEKFIELHPGHTVISYVNTTAAVKALTDIVVTSTNAKQIVDSLPLDEKIIFGPDKNLGDYINKLTGRNMLLWDGACHVHEQFSLEKILQLKREYPDALLLVHPECRKYIIEIADHVGSTSSIISFARNSEKRQFIVATESGILHQMQKENPDKEFIPAPPEDSTCACNDCFYMKMNTLEKLYLCLKNETPEIFVDEKIRIQAVKPIERMLEISAKYGL